MFVCLCNAVRESELKELAAKGVREPRAALAKLGVEPQCECCLDEVATILHGEAGFLDRPEPSSRPRPRFTLVS